MTVSTAPPEGPFLATGRGRVTLALLCAVTFLDVMDGAIVNVALPTIRTHLGFSVQNLQWVVSGYLITYAGWPAARGCWSAPGSPRVSGRR
jgi:MFS family permease